MEAAVEESGGAISGSSARVAAIGSSSNTERKLHALMKKLPLQVDFPMFLIRQLSASPDTCPATCKHYVALNFFSAVLRWPFIMSRSPCSTRRFEGKLCGSSGAAAGMAGQQMIWLCICKNQLHPSALLILSGSEGQRLASMCQQRSKISPCLVLMAF